jgi:pentatricopeptide repeat protein
MMKEKGVEPNIVTWNTLVVGYARLQDVEMTADAMSRLKHSGLKPEHITMSSLQKIRDRKALLEAMNRKEEMFVNPDPSFLDQLQDDMRKSPGDELSPDFEPGDDDFVVGDMEDSDAERTVDEAVHGFGARKEEDDNLEPR